MLQYCWLVRARTIIIIFSKSKIERRGEQVSTVHLRFPVEWKCVPSDIPSLNSCLMKGTTMSHTSVSSEI